MQQFELDGQKLTLAQVAAVAKETVEIELSKAARERIQASREVIERVVREGHVVYGVNTGFGQLSDVHISSSELDQLQLNLVRSHACGLGAPLSEQETRALILLRANVLARGNSGCRIEIVESLLDMLWNRLHPVIPEKGSVGASGDLVPLAHLTLA